MADTIWRRSCIPFTWLSCLAILFGLIAVTIVLSLIPLYIPSNTNPARGFSTRLSQIRYGLPRALVSDLSGGSLTLAQRNLNSDDVETLKATLQRRLNSSPRLRGSTITIETATISLAPNARRIQSRRENKKSVVSRQSSIVLTRIQNNIRQSDQLIITFQLFSFNLIQTLISSDVIANELNQIEFDVSTFLQLFGSTPSSLTSTSTISSSTTQTSSSSTSSMRSTSRVSSTVSTDQNVSASFIALPVKDSRIISVNGINFYGMKDFTGNVQNIYAIQTKTAIYTIKNGLVIRIQSVNETFSFNYNKTLNQYSVFVITKNSSYEISTSYNCPNVTFPTPNYQFSQDDTPPNIFTGILVDLSNTISGRSIEDATVVFKYVDSNVGNKSFVMWNSGGGLYYVPLPTNDPVDNQYFDANKLTTTVAQQSVALLQLIQGYPMSEICLQVPDAVNALCTSIAQDMNTTIPSALNISSQYASQFQVQSSIPGNVSDFEVIVSLPGEESLTVTLNMNDAVNETFQSSSKSSSQGFNNNQLNRFNVQVKGTRGSCNEQTIAGGDTPDDRLIDIGRSRTTVDFSYETYSIKDNIQVYYRGQLAFSTGCVGASGTTAIKLTDNESTLRVNVIPNCEGTVGTAWTYTVACSNGLICESNICYCGTNRARSTQIQNPSHNGCGGEGSALNYLINPIGSIWGFTPACNEHDECYETCNSLRSSCDSTFLIEMTLNCLKFVRIPKLYLHCQIWAGAFFTAVRLAGADFFIPAQEKSCDCPLNKKIHEHFYQNKTLIESSLNSQIMTQLIN